MSFTVKLTEYYFQIGTSHACGGNVDGRVGFITSPNYPNSYPHNLNCIWTVTRTAGSTFSLILVQFDTVCNDTVTVSIILFFYSILDQDIYILKMTHTHIHTTIHTDT